VTYEEKTVPGPGGQTRMIVCRLEDGREGAARVPPNGDVDEAKRRALKRAERSDAQ